MSAVFDVFGPSRAGSPLPPAPHAPRANRTANPATARWTVLLVFIAASLGEGGAGIHACSDLPLNVLTQGLNHLDASSSAIYRIFFAGISSSRLCTWGQPGQKGEVARSMGPGHLFTVGPARGMPRG